MGIVIKKFLKIVDLYAKFDLLKIGLNWQPQKKY
jgi:hypothetical protein